nr:MAG TPA: hypothetical protein [Caudoviricetes sp.]
MQRLNRVRAYFLYFCPNPAETKQNETNRQTRPT